MTSRSRSCATAETRPVPQIPCGAASATVLWLTDPSRPMDTATIAPGRARMPQESARLRRQDRRPWRWPAGFPPRARTISPFVPMSIESVVAFSLSRSRATIIPTVSAPTYAEIERKGFHVAVLLECPPQVARTAPQMTGGHRQRRAARELPRIDPVQDVHHDGVADHDGLEDIPEGSHPLRQGSGGPLPQWWQGRPFSPDSLFSWKLCAREMTSAPKATCR